MEPIVGNIFGFGNPVEIAIIAGVVVLLFGGSKLAGFGKNLGEGMKEFKKAVHESQAEPDLVATKSPVEPAAAPAAPAAVATAGSEPIAKEQ